MDVWFCILQEPPPRGNNRELKDLEKLFHALLLSASGELLPLDKDLSWMSANRKLSGFHGGINGRIPTSARASVHRNWTQALYAQPRASGPLIGPDVVDMTGREV